MKTDELFDTISKEGFDDHVSLPSLQLLRSMHEACIKDAETLAEMESTLESSQLGQTPLNVVVAERRRTLEDALAMLKVMEELRERGLKLREAIRIFQGRTRYHGGHPEQIEATPGLTDFERMTGKHWHYNYVPAQADTVVDVTLFNEIYASKVPEDLKQFLKPGPGGVLEVRYWERPEVTVE